MKMSMEQALDKLFAHLKSSYVRFMPDNKDMQDRYCNGLDIHIGKKYIKVVENNRVVLFIVNVHNDKKFQYGDILKSASWKTPAKNFARGNVFVPEKWQNIHWTGAS